MKQFERAVIKHTYDANRYQMFIAIIMIVLTQGKKSVNLIHFESLETVNCVGHLFTYYSFLWMIT